MFNVVRVATLVALTCLAAVGCASRWPQTIAARHFPDSVAAPDIEEVVDIGAGRIVTHGPLPVEGGGPDGIAAIGELLLLRGDNFSRQPTVSIAGVFAEVSGFGDDGSIIVRVPAGVPSGRQTLEVRSSGGSARSEVRVRRYALALYAQNSTIIPVAFDGGPPRAVSSAVSVRGATRVSISPDGSVAYAATGKHIVAIDMGAAGGPREILKRSLGSGTPIDFDVAKRKPIGVVLGPKDYVLVDLSRSRNPARYAPQPLPVDLAQQSPVSVAIAPDGDRIAFATARQNRITVMDISDPSNPRLGLDIPVMPDTVLPAICHMRFADDGTLWIAAGDSPRSIQQGMQPPQMVALRIADSEPAMTRIALPGKRAAIGLATPGKSQEQSGATIRQSRETIAVAMSALVATETHTSQLLRVTPDGNVLPVANSDARLGSVSTSKTGSLVVAAGFQSDKFGVLWSLGQQSGFMVLVPKKARPVDYEATSVTVQP